MKKTLTERTIIFLIAKGFEEEKSPSLKFRKFKNPRNPEIAYWVGNAGAVRKGTTIFKSISVTDFYREAMKKEGY